MLFNSYAFVFVFLPLSVFIFQLFSASSARKISLITVSLIFLALWSIFDTTLFLGSIITNYFLGLCIKKTYRVKYVVLCFAVLGNILFLGYFKYWDFLASLFNGTVFIPHQQVIPLAISFYTFEQIVYLNDVYKENKRSAHTFSEYLLYITFFPRLISGPLYYFNEYLPRFRSMLEAPIDWGKATNGIMIFVAALVKKIFIADYFAELADRFYTNITMFSTGDAWIGTFAYTLQIYFDFSAYSEMALGIGLLFGIQLPINFDTPYQAHSLSDFWKRWHMSLSRLIRDYIYIPLGGNRKGGIRQIFNLILTMSLAGIWHGAGVTFFLWGLGHGILLSINHLYSRIISFALPKIISVPLTLLSVHLLWVLFRSQDMAQAVQVYDKMLGTSLVTSYNHTEILYVLIGGMASIFFPSIKNIFLSETKTYYSFRPNILWLCFAVIMFVCSFLNMGKLSPFLYFNF